MKVYISGRITGRNIEESKAHFRNAERDLKNWQYYPVNPFDNGLSDKESWETHMLKDIEMLFPCDAIYMLSGWEHSKGAKIEKYIAETMGKQIWYEPAFIKCNAYPVTEEQFN